MYFSFLGFLFLCCSFWHHCSFFSPSNSTTWFQSSHSKCCVYSTFRFQIMSSIFRRNTHFASDSTLRVDSYHVFPGAVHFSSFSNMLSLAGTWIKMQNDDEFSLQKFVFLISLSKKLVISRTWYKDFSWIFFIRKFEFDAEKWCFQKCLNFES